MQFLALGRTLTERDLLRLTNLVVRHKDEGNGPSSLWPVAMRKQMWLFDKTSEMIVKCVDPRTPA